MFIRYRYNLFQLKCNENFTDYHSPDNFKMCYNLFQTDRGIIDKVLDGGYVAFDSSSGWTTRDEYLQCRIIDLPIAFSEQLSHIPSSKNTQI